MSDLEELKKVIKQNAEAITTLIQAETNSDRIKQEISSNNKVLEGLYVKIKAAKQELQSAQDQATGVMVKAKKDSDELIRSAELSNNEATTRLASAKKSQSTMQAKLDEADEMKKKHQAALVEVTAQKEKLKLAAEQLSTLSA